MKLSRLPELGIKERLAFLRHVVDALASSPFATRGVWKNAVVVWTPEATTVKHRTDFAGWLLANDLADLAHNVMSRRLQRRETLVYVEHDDGELAGVGIFSVDVRAELDAIADALTNPTAVTASREFRSVEKALSTPTGACASRAPVGRCGHTHALCNHQT